jgi:peptide/nickel transport system permease protein
MSIENVEIEGPIQAPPIDSGPNIWRKAWLFSRQWPIFSVALLSTLIFVGIFAPLIAPEDPIRPSLVERNAPPFWYSDAEYTRFLGADQLGRDVFSRLVHGARISLIVVSVSIVSGLLVGSAMGLVAGYFGGVIDEILMRIVDVWLSIPFILLAMVAVIIFGQSFTVLVLLLALFSWVPFVRNVRAETLTLKERDYVMMSRVVGASTFWILFRHILPGTINTIMVIASLRVGQLIMIESILSFLGAGIPPPTPSWGVMINDGRAYINDAWWISFFPGMAIILIVLAANFFGDWVRDHFDPRLRDLGNAPPSQQLDAESSHEDA